MVLLVLDLEVAISASTISQVVSVYRVPKLWFSEHTSDRAFIEWQHANFSWVRRRLAFGFAN